MFIIIGRNFINAYVSIISVDTHSLFELEYDDKWTAMYNIYLRVCSLTSIKRLLISKERD